MKNCGTEARIAEQNPNHSQASIWLNPAPVAERVGFEPTLQETCKPDFESGAFDHSATFPRRAALYRAFSDFE
jgi:hypothetical protein